MIFNKPNKIFTSRLSLRSINCNDIECVVDILSNDKIAETFILPDFKSPEEKNKLFNRLADLSEKCNRFVYGIDLRNKLIGFINDVEIEDNQIELGIVIHPDYWRNGYATEVLTAAIATLFDMGYSVVKTAAFEENLASLRVMEKSGMIRLDYVDTLEYRGVIHKCIWYEKRKIFK